MKMKYDPKVALKVPLDSYEQEQEDAIDEASPPAYADPDTVKKFRRAARESLREIQRGGARPGAGRKPRPHIRTTVLLDPKIRAKLDRLATREGSLSAAVEKLVKSA